jgi:type IV secretion system protein VirB5
MKGFASALALVALLGLSNPAHAQWAVFDAANFAQLLQQVNYWQQQIKAMQAQVGQLQQTYSAITGPRGMQALVPLTFAARNYLPPDLANLTAVLNQSSVLYAALSNAQSQTVAANAVLSPAAIAALSPANQQLLAQRRRNAALIQTLGQSALQTTSARFQTLQTLISSIGAAQDSKAIADLQGRIVAEQAMLTNDQSKLETLFQLSEAQRRLTDQRADELGIQAVGKASQLAPVAY